MSAATDELQRLLQLSYLSKSDVLNLLVHTRIVLEEQGKQKTYRYLKLYCDWALHSSIDRNDACYDILVALTEILVRDNTINKPEKHPEISRVISIPGLRQDFVDLFSSQRLPVAAFRVDETWKQMFGVIAHILLDRPIRFADDVLSGASPNSRAGQAYAEVLRLSAGTSLAIIGFEFIIYANSLWYRTIIPVEGVDLIAPLVFVV